MSGERAAPLGGAVLGLGVDLVDIARFESVLGRRPGLAQRLFGDEELRIASRMSRPGPTLAGRFAAKEAVMKALGVGIGAFAWTDVTVSRLAGGAPGLTLGGRAATLALSRGVGGWHLSISHTSTVATATAMAVA